MVQMTSTKYAERRGVSRQAVDKAIKSLRLGTSVSRDARGHVLIDADLADLEWERSTDPTRRPQPESTPAPAGDGETLLEAKARRERALATMAEIELKRRSGELVLASDVLKEWTTVLRAARSKLLSLPTRLRSDCPEIGVRGFVSATEVVREVLEELAADSGGVAS